MFHPRCLGHCMRATRGEGASVMFLVREKGPGGADGTPGRGDRRRPAGTSPGKPASGLVLPGLLASDSSTLPLRTFLRWLGYHVRGWDLGRNHGPTEAVLAGLPRAVLDHAERSGRPVSLIGWSLGGIYAREMARRHPRQVRQVITLGSPYAMRDPEQSHAHGPYRRLRSLHAPEARMPGPELRSRPIAVPPKIGSAH